MPFIPKTSPLHFQGLHSPISGYTLSELSCCGYDWAQCFLSTDVLCLQIVADNFLSIPQVEISNGEVSQTYTRDNHSGLVNNFKIDLSEWEGEQVTISAGTVAGGNFVATDQASTINIVSPDCGFCSIWMEWGADCSAMNTEYGTGFEKQGIRLKSVYLRPSTSVTARSISKNAQGVWSMCNSELDESYELVLQAAPYWVFQLLEKAANHPYFCINGERFIINGAVTLGQSYQSGELRRISMILNPVQNEFDIRNCCVL